jgi:hypothetical protein
MNQGAKERRRKELGNSTIPFKALSQHTPPPPAPVKGSTTSPECHCEMEAMSTWGFGGIEHINHRPFGSWHKYIPFREWLSLFSVAIPKCPELGML